MIVELYTDSRGLTRATAYPDDAAEIKPTNNYDTVFDAKVTNDKNLFVVKGKVKEKVWLENDPKLNVLGDNGYSSNVTVEVDSYFSRTYDISGHKVFKYKKYHKRTFLEWLKRKPRTYDETLAMSGYMVFKNEEGNDFTYTAQKYIYRRIEEL